MKYYKLDPTSDLDDIATDLFGLGAIERLWQAHELDHLVLNVPPVLGRLGLAGLGLDPEG